MSDLAVALLIGELGTPRCYSHGPMEERPVLEEDRRAWHCTGCGVEATAHAQAHEGGYATLTWTVVPTQLSASPVIAFGAPGGRHG